MSENQQGWRIDESFSYSQHQFVTLAKITLSISVVSMVGSLITILFFAIFVYQKSKMADRVSLRCVATASVVNLVDAITNMSMVLYKGAIVPCRALAILVQFSDVLGACLLSTIGVNLVLVFVIKVKRSNILERFYYPFCILYSLTTVVIPIYEESQMKNQHPPRVDCWIYNNFTHRHAHVDSWIYFYALVFFIMIVGLICAAIAAIKLLREEYQNHQIIHGGALADTNNGLRFSQSNAYRVITRCIIYSSVPFFCHIFGFTLHLLGMTSRNIPMGFTAIYAAMSVAEGVMTTLIFFSEPAVCEYIREISRTWYRKYVEEFRIVERPDRRRSSATIISTVSQMTIPKLQEYHEKISLPRMQARSPRIFYDSSAISSNVIPAEEQQDLGDPSFLQVPTTPDTDAMSLSTTTTMSSNISCSDSNTRSVPMRCVKPRSPICNRINRRMSSHHSCPAIITSDDGKEVPDSDYLIVDSPNTANDEVYVPYRFPRLARIANWILLHVIRDTQHGPPHNDADNLPPPNSIVIDPRT